jgi:hypothetical protein
MVPLTLSGLEVTQRVLADPDSGTIPIDPDTIQSKQC